MLIHYCSLHLKSMWSPSAAYCTANLPWLSDNKPSSHVVHSDHECRSWVSIFLLSKYFRSSWNEYFLC